MHSTRPRLAAQDAFKKIIALPGRYNLLQKLQACHCESTMKAAEIVKKYIQFEEMAEIPTKKKLDNLLHRNKAGLTEKLNPEYLSASDEIYTNPDQFLWYNRAPCAA